MYIPAKLMSLDGAYAWEDYVIGHGVCLDFCKNTRFQKFILTVEGFSLN